MVRHILTVTGASAGRISPGDDGDYRLLSLDGTAPAAVSPG
jgi:hypothetical protein